MSIMRLFLGLNGYSNTAGASEMDPTLGFYTILKWMFDLGHLGDKIGIVHQFRLCVAPRQDNAGVV